MDTSSNIKFNVEGDDKFSQFLEKTSKSLKELSDKTLKAFTSGFSNSSKEINNSQKAVEKLLVDYKKLTTDTNNLAKATQGLTKSFGLAFTAFNIYTNVTTAQSYFDIVVNGMYEVRDAVSNTNRGLTIMAASGYDATPLIGTFKEVRDVILGSSEAISVFTTKSTLAFNQFEQKLNEVNIIFGLSQERLSEYGDALQNGLEKNLKNSVSSLTALSAAYQAASAGFTEFQQNLDVVQLAVKANKAAPGSDLFQVGGAIGKGAGVLETKDIKELELTTSKWIATEQLGLTTVGEMTESISDMYMALKNAGVGTDSLVDQTQGLIVAFTKLGAKIPDITTQMEAFSRGVISKTPEAQKALEGLVDAQGKAITLNQEYFKDKGIVKGLTDFAEAVGYNTEKIKEVFNETRSFAFVMKVLAQNGNLAKDSIEQISKVTSENLTQAFDSATSSSQTKMEQITNSYDEIMIEFGKAFKERSQKGIESIELYKELLVTFKEPLIQLAQSSVTLFDNLSKITGVIGAVAKTLLSIGGTLLSFRAFGLILGGLTNGFKDLRKESGVIKDLYTSNQGLVAIGKQVLGIDQQRLLSQDRINKAIANSVNLENTLIDSIGKTNEERISSISAVQKEIDAIVARDQSIIKSQQNVDKVEQSLKDKQSKRDNQKTELDSTKTNLSSLKNVKKEIDTKLSDDASNIVRAKKLEELAAKESLIRQGNIGEQEKKQLAAINSEKLRLQHTYSQSTLKELEDLEKQKSIIRNKTNKSDKDLDALAVLRSKELAVLEKERNKTKAPLSDKEKSDLTKASQNLTSKIEQEQLVMLTQRQKLQEANNAVDKETKKLGDAKVKQTENLNRVTKTTAELAILQQDLNTKKINLDRVDIAFKGQQQRLYQIQNSLRKEQNTLDKITNKDSEEYQKQLTKVNKLQKEEAAQIFTVQKARITQQKTQQDYNRADIESRTKLRQLTKEQGLAEGSLIELKTKSGTVTLKNTFLNRGLVSTVEGYGKAVQALKNPTQSFADSQVLLKNKIIDLKSNIGQLGASASRSFEGMAAKAKTSFVSITNAVANLGESIKGALISSGVGLIIGALIGAGVKVFQLRDAAEKLDRTYKELNKTLEESAIKFDKANISFEKGSNGLSKFSDKLEAAKKLNNSVDPTIWDSVGEGIKKAGTWLVDFVDIGGTLTKQIPMIWNSFGDGEFIKRTAKMSQISDFIQGYEIALRGQNKELAEGNLLTETSNQKIKAKMILTGEDLEREKAANSTRIESFQAMTDVQKKELEELKGKGDKLNDRDKAQVSLLEAEIARREKLVEVSKKQFDEQLKYYEARNLLLDRENKFSNTQVSLKEIQSLQGQVDSSQTALNKNITEGLDIYSSSIKDSSIKSKQFFTDLKDGSLSVKASIKSLGGEIYKVGEDGKVVSKLPADVLKSIQDAIKGKEVDGKKYSLEQVLNLKETRDALKEAGVTIPKDLKVLADKMKAGYEASEGELQLINLKDLEKDLANFSTLSDKYQEKKRQFLSTTKDDIGATTFSTSLKKSLRLAETDLQDFNNALDASSKGANKFVTASTEKFTKEALDGTLDLTEGLKTLGKVVSEVDFKQLEKLKLAITGKNKDEILVALKEIGVETEKALTADSIDLNKFEANLGGFVESLNAVAESGEATSEEIAKKFENVYNQMKGRVTPAGYKALTETLISYEKAASDKRINLLTIETNALEQQKKYRLILETDYIKEINQLNIRVTEENVNNKKIELKRLLTIYRDSAPQVVKAKAELDSLELSLRNQKLTNPIEIAQAESKAKFDILKKDLELGRITKRQYIEEELEDNERLYKTQVTEKQKTLAELMRDEVKNAKAIKALRKSMESNEKDYNLNVLEINRRRIEEQFKLQTNALGKRELAARESAINGTTKAELESNRQLEKDKIALNIQTLQTRLSVEKKGSDKFLEIEKQLIEARLSLRETEVKQTKDRVNESIEAKKIEFSTIAALEERNNAGGTTNESLEKTRKLKEQEVQLTIDSIKSQISLTEKGSTQRLALEAQLIQEVNKLQKTQLDNQKSKLEDSLDKTQKALEKRQIVLEKLTVAGTTNEDLEASRKLKEDEISNIISSLKQRSNLYKVGSKERIALEQEIAKETLKLDKQVYENQKSRLEQQINDKKRAFKSSQLDLEKLLVLGTSVEDAKKVRAAKEEEIRLNIDFIRKQVVIAKVGSTQRKDLEVSLKDEIIKLDKQKIANKRDLIEEEISLERGKISKIESLLERSNINGTFEENLEKIRVLKEKEVQINISSLQKELAIYKGNAKEKAGLETTLTQLITKQQTLRFSNRKERLEAELALSKSNLEKLLALKESALIDGGTEEELKAIESMKVKEIQLNVDSIRKQIKLYKEGSKERLALEINLQKELNNLRKASLDKEKNLIQLALDFKKTKVDIANIDLEKSLLKGDITREEFEDKLTISNQKINLLQQEVFVKQLKLYQKGSKEYLEILKDLSQLQVDYQKSVVDKAIREIDRLVKKQNNSIEAQKQNIQKQLNVGDYLTKQLQEQIKLEESKNSVIKATSDYQVGLLEITKRTTGDIEKKAKIDLQIAEIKQKSLLESQKLEINSIENNNAINQSALEREKIQLRLNKLELDRSKILAETELRKAKLNKLDKASIDALELQLQNINTQYEELKRSENLINTQIRNQAEISANQLKIVKQQQDLAKRNGELDVEQIKQTVIIAGYEKQLSQLKMKGMLLEANSNKEKVIGELLTKAYDTQLSLLNSRKELMDSTLSSIDTLYGIEQSMAKSDLTKEKLAQDQARDKLVFLELQQKMERDSFNLEKAKNKIVRERQKAELEIAEINAKQALAVAKVEQAKINARKDATDEEKLAAKLAVDSAEKGIIAAKANKELSLEISKIEEQSEKNKDIIFNRNQRNQRLQAQAAAAQTTANTLDDSEVAAQARKFREQDERSLRDTALISTGKIDKIISDFQKAIEAKKPISLNIVKKIEVPIKSSTIEATTSRKDEDKETPKTKIEITPVSNKTEKIEKPIEKKEEGNREPDNKTLNTSITDIGTSITNTIKSSSETLGKLIKSSLKGLGDIIVASINGTSVKPVTPTTKPVKPIVAKLKPQPKLPAKGTIIKGINGQEDSIVVEQPIIVAPPNPNTYAPGSNKKNPVLEPKTKEPLVDSLKTIRQSVDAFKLSFDKSNQTKKTEEDLRNKNKGEDTIHTDIKELIGVMQEYINKGGNVTINSPINVNGGSKETGVDINTHLYNLATKLERRQK